jgi:hypothetical protein
MDVHRGRILKEHCMRLSLRLPAAAFALSLFASTSFAGSPLVGFDAMSSTVMQSGQSSFSGLGFRARVHLPQFVDNLEFLPTVELWRDYNRVQSFGVESTRRDAALGVDARWNFPHEVWTPYVGAGLATHFMTEEVHAPTLGVNHRQDSVVKGGLAALAGVTFPLSGRLENVMELKYHHLPGVAQFKISWGLAYRL